MSNEIEYIPFGEEWEKELMKSPKKFIIGLYRKSCLKNKNPEVLIEALEKVLEKHGYQFVKDALTKYKGE